MRKVFAILLMFIAVLALNGCGNNPDEPGMPEGFSHVEGTVEEGYVIEDEKGNQFVWVPADHAYRCDAEDSRELGDEPIQRIFYGEGRKEAVTHGAEDDISHFIDSVRKHKGFYISRYEVGDESAESFRKSNTEGKAASREGLVPYNFVTRDQALELARGFYNGSDATSTLISSYAWDMTCRFIEEDPAQAKSGDDPDREDAGETEEPHPRTLQKTGGSEERAGNIFDMAGNLSEWTTEYSSNAYYDYHDDCVYRGNNYVDDAGDPTVRRCNSNVMNETTGFRIVIYL